MRVRLAADTVTGLLRFRALGWLKHQGLSLIQQQWQWPSEALVLLESSLHALVGSDPVWQVTTPPPFPGLQAVTITTGPDRFPHAFTLFQAALASGWDWTVAVTALAPVSHGWFQDSGHTFIVAGAQGSPLFAALHGPWTSASLAAFHTGPSVQVYLCQGVAVAFCALQSLRLRQRPPGRGEPHRRSRFLPEFIRLPHTNGRVTLPRFRVTSVVERRQRWIDLLGNNLDGTARAIVSGRLVYPRRWTTLMSSWKRNHPSLDQDEEVKRLLGPKLAVYLYQGALEYVPPGCPMPTQVEPHGAIFKQGPDGRRLISDARISNEGVEPWGVHFHTINDLADMLDWNDIMLQGNSGGKKSF